MVALTYVVSSVGLFVLSVAFARLAGSNGTEELYLQVLEYGFAIAFLVVGAGLLVIAVL